MVWCYRPDQCWFSWGLGHSKLINIFAFARAFFSVILRNARISSSRMKTAIPGKKSNIILREWKQQSLKKSNGETHQPISPSSSPLVQILWVTRSVGEGEGDSNLYLDQNSKSQKKSPAALFTDFFACGRFKTDHQPDKLKLRSFEIERYFRSRAMEMFRENKTAHSEPKTKTGGFRYWSENIQTPTFGKVYWFTPKVARWF